jgi:hypothetical protein
MNSASQNSTAIAALAYTYWESEGRPDGRALDHWVRAEQALTISAPTRKSQLRSKGRLPREERPHA